MEPDTNLVFMQEHTQSIREDFIYLTEEILKKDMKSANKQLQDTLMNYFLENQVGSLLKKPMNQTSKRSIRSMIEKELPEQGTKYINLLNAFEKNLKQYNVSNEYIDLLKDLILTPNSHPRGQDNWKALVRKRILAVLLILHWYDKTKEYSDFFQLWDEVYPNNPLPKRKPKQKRKRKNNTDMIDKNERKQIKANFQQKYEETDSINEKRLQLQQQGMEYDDDDDDEDKMHVNIKQESNSFPIDQLKQLNLHQQPSQQNLQQQPQQQKQQQQQQQQQQQVLMNGQTPFINLNMVNQQQYMPNNLQRSQDDSNKFIFDQNTMYALHQNYAMNGTSPMNAGINGMSPIMQHHIQQQHLGAQSPYYSNGNSPSCNQQINSSPQNMMKNFASFTQSMNQVPADYTPKMEEKDMNGNTPLMGQTAFTPLNQQQFYGQMQYPNGSFGYQVQNMGINQMVNYDQSENKNIDTSPTKQNNITSQNIQLDRLNNVQNNSTIPEQQVEETSSAENSKTNQQNQQQQQQNQQIQQQNQQIQQQNIQLNLQQQNSGISQDQNLYYNGMIAPGFTPQMYNQQCYPMLSPMMGNASNSNTNKQKKFQLNLQDASQGYTSFGEAVSVQKQQEEQTQQQQQQQFIQQQQQQQSQQQEQNGNDKNQQQQQQNKRRVILLTQNSGTPANFYGQGFEAMSPSQNSPGLYFQQNFNNGSPSLRNQQFQQYQQQQFFKMGSNSRQGSINISEEGGPGSSGIKKPVAQKKIGNMLKSQNSISFETTPQHFFAMPQGQYLDYGTSPQHNMYFAQYAQQIDQNAQTQSQQQQFNNQQQSQFQSSQQQQQPQQTQQENQQSSQQPQQQSQDNNNIQQQSQSQQQQQIQQQQQQMQFNINVNLMGYNGQIQQQQQQIQLPQQPQKLEQQPQQVGDLIQQQQ